jgi:hypothetical protein
MKRKTITLHAWPCRGCDVMALYKHIFYIFWFFLSYIITCIFVLNKASHSHLFTTHAGITVLEVPSPLPATERASHCQYKGILYWVVALTHYNIRFQAVFSGVTALETSFSLLFVFFLCCVLCFDFINQDLGLGLPGVKGDGERYESF